MLSLVPHRALGVNGPNCSKRASRPININPNAFEEIADRRRTTKQAETAKYQIAAEHKRRKTWGARCTRTTLAEQSEEKYRGQ
jgi:hypothetical protein